MNLCQCVYVRAYDSLTIILPMFNYKYFAASAAILTIITSFFTYTLPVSAKTIHTSSVLFRSKKSPNVSTNWAGYVATSGPFSAISGSWTIPQVHASNTFAADASWIGIGGVSSSDLIQSGTQSMNGPDGSVTYDAWIETLPQAPVTIPVSVSPGDQISVSITEKSKSHWNISFTDQTTTQSYTKSISYASKNSSAEWIEEAPSDQYGVLPLDTFKNIHFTNGSVSEAGQTLSIASAHAQAIAMVNQSGTLLASPSALTSSGDGFTVTRTATKASKPSAKEPVFTSLHSHRISKRLLR